MRVQEWLFKWKYWELQWFFIFKPPTYFSIRMIHIQYEASRFFKFPNWNEHGDVIKWKHFPRYWTFVRGIHRSPVNSLHKGQWCGALVFSLICVWINGWVNNDEAGDLRRYRAHYDVTVMYHALLHMICCKCQFMSRWLYTEIVCNQQTWCKSMHIDSIYKDVIMGAIAPQITSLTIVYSTVYSDADQTKHQSSASLSFVRGIHRGPVNSPHKWPVTRKRFLLDDVMMWCSHLVLCEINFFLFADILMQHGPLFEYYVNWSRIFLQWFVELEGIVPIL